MERIALTLKHPWLETEPSLNTDNFVSVYYYRGPLCLLRIELGVLTNGRLGTVEMVSEYIKHEQAEEVHVAVDILLGGLEGLWTSGF